jgi:hypothetical protein
MAITFPPRRKPDFNPQMREPHPANKIRNWPPVAYLPLGPKTGFDTDAVKHKEVKPGPLDTFWDLAAEVDRQNPWDIIIYNFETEQPLEVNWYLHHAVGCWKSDDGQNFSFRRADPGVLYLPLNKKWKPPHWFTKGSGVNRFVTGLITTVVGMLERAATGFPTVQLSTTKVSADDLRKVGELLSTGQVTLSIEPGNMAFEGVLGQYIPASKTVRLARPPRLDDSEMLGVVCNEATGIISHYRNKIVYMGPHELASTIVESIAVAKEDRQFAEKSTEKTLMGPGRFMPSASSSKPTFSASRRSMSKRICTERSLPIRPFRAARLWIRSPYSTTGTRSTTSGRSQEASGTTNTPIHGIRRRNSSAPSAGSMRAHRRAVRGSEHDFPGSLNIQVSPSLS